MWPGLLLDLAFSLRDAHACVIPNIASYRELIQSDYANTGWANQNPRLFHRNSLVGTDYSVLGVVELKTAAAAPGLAKAAQSNASCQLLFLRRVEMEKPQGNDDFDI